MVLLRVVVSRYWSYMENLSKRNQTGSLVPLLREIRLIKSSSEHLVLELSFESWVKLQLIRCG